MKRVVTAPLVVIPTYNERANLRHLLPKVLAEVRGIQVLVVDDGSPDGTAHEAERWARLKPGRVHLLQRGAKKGLGTAYVDGFGWGLQRGHRVLVQMDADFSHDPAALPALIAGLKDADVVVGSRYLGGKVSVVNWPLRRLALSMGANAYVRAVTGLPLSDCTAGFKAWRAETLANIALERVRSDGYSFQVEMNYKAWKRGFRFREIPIIFNDRGEGASKMSPAVIREAVWRVWALRLGW
jgi:dolichol-phosphate mannosyltransferase